MTLDELHDRIRATRPSAWHVLLPGPEVVDDAEPESAATRSATAAAGSATAVVGAAASPPRHRHRAVLRHDVDVVLEWGMRESSLDYFDPWLGNFERRGRPARAERILLDVLVRGSIVDRLRGLAFADVLLPFPKSRVPRAKGLPDRYFPRAEAEVWALVDALHAEGDPVFERAVYDSGLRIG